MASSRYSSSTLLILFLILASFLIQHVDAKPHGYKGQSKIKRSSRSLRAPQLAAAKRNPIADQASVTILPVVKTTTTTCTVTPTGTASSGSPHNAQCRRTKVAVLGAGVAGITAAVCLFC